MIHGEESITDVIPFVQMDQSPKAEKDRLNMIYGETTVTEVWGRRPPQEMEAPKATLVGGLVWKNPLTGQIETTGKGGKGSGSYEPPPPPSSEAFESRPAVEIVGDPTAGTPEDDDTMTASEAFDAVEEPEEKPAPKTPPKAAPKKK